MDSTIGVPAPEANLESIFAATVNENVHEDGTQPLIEDVTTNTAVPGVSTPQSGANGQSPDQGRISSGNLSADNPGSPSDFSRVTLPNPVLGNQDQSIPSDSNTDPQQAMTQQYQWVIQQQQRELLLQQQVYQLQLQMQQMQMSGIMGIQMPWSPIGGTPNMLRPQMPSAQHVPFAMPSTQPQAGQQLSANTPAPASTTQPAREPGVHHAPVPAVQPQPATGESTQPQQVSATADQRLQMPAPMQASMPVVQPAPAPVVQQTIAPLSTPVPGLQKLEERKFWKLIGKSSPQLEQGRSGYNHGQWYQQPVKGDKLPMLTWNGQNPAKTVLPWLKL